MKKILIALTFLILTYSLFQTVTAQEVCVDFFFSTSCPHCDKEKVFLNELKNKYDLKINKYEVHDSENKVLFKNLIKEFNLSSEVSTLLITPTTFIDDKAFMAFDHGDTEIFNPRYQAYLGYSEIIEKTIQECFEKGGCVCPSEKCGDNGNLNCDSSKQKILLIVGGISAIVFVLLLKLGIKFKIGVKK